MSACATAAAHLNVVAISLCSDARYASTPSSSASLRLRLYLLRGTIHSSKFCCTPRKYGKYQSNQAVKAYSVKSLITQQRKVHQQLQYRAVKEASGLVQRV
jgi:hypothetical protein